MIDIKQRLLEILNLDTVFITIVFLEGGVIVVGELGLRIQFVKYLCHVEALRVLLIPIPVGRCQTSTTENATTYIEKQMNGSKILTGSVQQRPSFK